MIYLRSSVVLACMLVVGCASVHSRILKSADTLESSASTFVGQAGRDFPHAVDFARETHAFLATVDHAGDSAVLLAYEHVWDEYHALREEVERSNSPAASVDFKPVTQAFSSVARDVHGYSDADASIYARGGFQHDPYYDP
jgi:PHD/YefM family antitoxin component YafN of YafNO toxin-antitoxin module